MVADEREPGGVGGRETEFAEELLPAGETGDLEGLLHGSQVDGPVNLEVGGQEAGRLDGRPPADSSRSPPGDPPLPASALQPRRAPPVRQTARSADHRPHDDDGRLDLAQEASERIDPRVFVNPHREKVRAKRPHTDWRVLRRCRKRGEVPS